MQLTDTFFVAGTTYTCRRGTYKVLDVRAKADEIVVR